MATSFSRLIE